MIIRLAAASPTYPLAPPGTRQMSAASTVRASAASSTLVVEKTTGRWIPAR